MNKKICPTCGKSRDLRDHIPGKSDICSGHLADMLPERLKPIGPLLEKVVLLQSKYRIPDAEIDEIVIGIVELQKSRWINESLVELLKLNREQEITQANLLN